MEELEYLNLVRDLKQAEQNFNQADPEYINIAIFNLMYAEMKLDQYEKEQTKSPKAADTALRANRNTTT